MKTKTGNKRFSPRRIISILFWMMIPVAMLLFTGCEKQKDETQVSFFLTDAPSLQGYKAVNIDIAGVSYSVDGVAWQQLPISAGIYNLMELTNGNDTLLSRVVLNEGERIHQVRLLLGPHNTLVLRDNTVVDLTTPSGQTSGIKINIQDSAVAYSSYAVLIDFDAERSVVKRGNSGAYNLKPVIRGFIRENTSLLYGTILPDSIPYRVSAIRGTDTMNCVSDTSVNNRFVVQGLRSGTWSVEFRNATNALLKTSSVNVIGGFDVNMGVVDLTH